MLDVLALLAVRPRNRAGDLLAAPGRTAPAPARRSRSDRSAWSTGSCSSMTKRCSGSGSMLRMRTFLLPSLSVKVSIVLRRAMSMISTFSMPRFDRVEARPVARQRRAARHARRERDRPDHLLGRLVDHVELVREGADDERAVAGADRRRGAQDASAGDQQRRGRRQRVRHGGARVVAAVLTETSRSIFRQSFWAAAHLDGPVRRVVELIGHLRRPVAADVAVEQVALDRLTQSRGAAGRSASHPGENTSEQPIGMCAAGGLAASAAARRTSSAGAVTCSIRAALRLIAFR